MNLSKINDSVFNDKYKGCSMDMTQIPRSFWHSLSVSIIAATIGILYIAYRSSSISIEIANAKIEVSSVLSKAKDIKTTLQEENIRLVNINKSLQQRIARLEKTLEKNANAKLTMKDLKKRDGDWPEPALLFKQQEEQKSIQKKFKSLEQQIESAEKRILKSY